MKDTELYSQILGIRKPWKVIGVNVELAANEVEVTVVHAGGEFTCPKCSKPYRGYDHRQRRWRHLDTCQLKTVLVADVPRVECPEHGVVTMSVPWAEPVSSFTALFEALVIDWLKAASVSAVSTRLQLSWDAVDGIMQRAVRRGLSRRDEINPKRLSVDEVAYRKEHRYVTIVTDQQRGVVLHVSQEREASSLKAFYDTLSPQQLEGIDSVCMDMWPAYMKATREALEDAESKIAFDRFHIAQYLGKAVDQVRRQEHRQRLRLGDDRMKGTKYHWLSRRGNLNWHQQRRFTALRQSSLKTARAWAMKELSSRLWNYESRTWAQKGWKRLINWMARSRLKPMIVTAATLRRHLTGILNAVMKRVSNGHAESMNSRIKTLKTRARGFRNQQRFLNAIYFHLGGLQLYPDGLAG